MLGWLSLNNILHCSSCGKEFAEKEKRKFIEIRAYFTKEVTEQVVPAARQEGIEFWTIKFDTPVEDTDFHRVRMGILCDSCYEDNIKSKLPTVEEFEENLLKILDKKYPKVADQKSAAV